MTSKEANIVEVLLESMFPEDQSETIAKLMEALKQLVTIDDQTTDYSADRKSWERRPSNNNGSRRSKSPRDTYYDTQKPYDSRRSSSHRGQHKFYIETRLDNMPEDVKSQRLGEHDYSNVIEIPVEYFDNYIYFSEGFVALSTILKPLNDARLYQEKPAVFSEYKKYQDQIRAEWRDMRYSCRLTLRHVLGWLKDIGWLETEEIINLKGEPEDIYVPAAACEGHIVQIFKVNPETGEEDKSKFYLGYDLIAQKKIIAHLREMYAVPYTWHTICVQAGEKYKTISGHVIL